MKLKLNTFNGMPSNKIWNKRFRQPNRKQQ